MVPPGATGSGAAGVTVVPAGSVVLVVELVELVDEVELLELDDDELLEEDDEELLDELELLDDELVLVSLPKARS